MPEVIRELRERLNLWNTAVRDGLLTVLPIAMVGTVAALVVMATTAGDQSSASAIGQQVSKVASLLESVTIGSLGIFVSVSIAVRAYKKIHPENRADIRELSAVGMLAMLTFLVLATPVEVGNGNNYGYFSILEAIFAALVTVEMAGALMAPAKNNNGLKGVDEGSFLNRIYRITQATFLLVVTTLAVKTLLFAASGVANNHGIWDRWNMNGSADFLAHPVTWVGQVVQHQAHSFLGFGSVSSDQASSSVQDPDSAAAPGGFNNSTPGILRLLESAAVLGMVLAVLIKGKDPKIRQLAWISAVPSMVGLHYVMLIGLPIILNWRVCAAFVAGPVIGSALVLAGLWLSGISWNELALSKTVVSAGTPALGLAFSSTHAGAFFAVTLVVVFLLFLPYLQHLDEEQDKQLKLDIQNALHLIGHSDAPSAHVISRPDRLGEVARRVLHDLENDLHRNHLEIAYQPQLDKYGMLVGVEALVRWNHPVYGPIPPDSMIRLAEESGLIKTLGAWVLTKVCSDLSDWKKQGYIGFKVSVNVSSLEMEDDQWFEHTQKILESYGIRPEELELEITEKRSITASLVTEANLRKLNSYGYHISMDDFGYGVSSLLHMQRYKLRSIKIDQCLTSGIEKNEVNQDIIRTLAKLAKEQDIRVIAEHVDSHPQRAMLELLGCNVFQGWLYSRAVSKLELLEFIKKSEGQIFWPKIVLDDEAFGSTDDDLMEVLDTENFEAPASVRRSANEVIS